MQAIVACMLVHKINAWHSIAIEIFDRQCELQIHLIFLLGDLRQLLDKSIILETRFQYQQTNFFFDSLLCQ